MRQSRLDTTQAIVLAVLLHALLLLAVWLSAHWVLHEPTEAAAGPPIMATLEFSAADLHRAEDAIKAARKSSKSPKPPAPQPLPSSRPQTSDEPLQATPQAPQPVPDTVDQQRLDPNADLQAQQKLADQARQRQEQVDLTEDIQRQQETEHRQRLREQLEAIQQERKQAEQQTDMEAQRLQQLADMSTPAPKPVKPQAASATPPAGNNGQDKGLVAAYTAALHQTAQENWNTSLAPELQRCQVRFTQIPGGEVINVEFMACPYDAQARDSVERALRKTPMPYAGFESVFQRQITLTMCYPKEACE